MTIAQTLHGLYPQEHLRPRAGDICILLAPSYEQVASLRQRLQRIQEDFKGLINPTPFLQLQRFRIGKEALDVLKPSLKMLAANVSPIPIQAKTLEPFYSTLRTKELLKCRVDILGVEKIYGLLVKLLLDGNIAPLELELSPYVTILEDIKMVRLNTKAFNELLFVAQRLVIVRLKGPGFYTALYSIPLAECKDEEARVEHGYL
jgi:hypothetical protein